MAAETPTVIPAKHRAGDTLLWTQSIPDYLPGDGWTAKCKLSNATQDLAILTSAQDGEQHAFTVASATTALWAAGTYQYVIYVEDAGPTNRHTISSGAIEIQPDLTTAGAYDGLGHARKVLAQIESLIEGKFVSDRQAYTINGRSLTHYTPEQLVVLHDRYRRMVKQLEREERIAKGLGPGKSKVKVRFR